MKKESCKKKKKFVRWNHKEIHMHHNLKVSSPGLQQLEPVPIFVFFSARIFWDDTLITFPSLSTVLPINSKLAFEQNFQAKVPPDKCLVRRSYW